MTGSSGKDDTLDASAPRNSLQAVLSLLLGVGGCAFGLGVMLARSALSAGSQPLPGAVWVCVFVSGLAALVLGHRAHPPTARYRPAPPGVHIAGLGAMLGSAGMLCALIFPAMDCTNHAREQARRINCTSCLKNFGLASRMYSGDYDEWLPDSLMRLPELDYLTTTKIWTCPSTSTAAAADLDELRSGKHMDYLYFGAGLTEDCAGHDATKTILGCDMPGNHAGFFNVWFADGHVKGYRGRCIEEIARQNDLFLPGYNLRVPPAAEQKRLRAARKAPSVVRTEPKNWATDIDSSLTEILVEFDRDMEKGSSWCGSGSWCPETTGELQWRTPRICVLPVRLEPGRFYSLWTSSRSVGNFRGVNGTQARGYSLVFATRCAEGAPAQARPVFPQVLKTVPADGDCYVDPELTEIVVEFDRDMASDSSCCLGGLEYPRSVNGAVWRTPRVCVLIVSLDPERAYSLGLNSRSRRRFRSKKGIPLQPVTLLFGTAIPKSEADGAGARRETLWAESSYRGPRLRRAFEQRMARDRQVFSVEEQIEIEMLYRAARESRELSDRTACYEKLITTYKSSNRAGCAMVDLGYIREGEEREKCLRAAIAEHSDCLYEDGVPVGIEARFLLGKICHVSGRCSEASRLFAELCEQFPDATDHHGNRYVDQIPE